MARPDSEDGWQPPRLDPNSSLLAWDVVPGTDPPVHLQIMVGWPTTVLLAFAADLNEFVEHMRDADSACYTPTNSVDTSNHLNGRHLISTGTVIRSMNSGLSMPTRCERWQSFSTSTLSMI